MKRISIIHKRLIYLFALATILHFGFVFTPQAAGENVHESKSIMDIIPYESIACASISGLEDVFHTVTNSPEWEELTSVEEVKDDLEQATQMLPIIPMIFGITTEELLNAFGHQMAFSFMGMEGEMPVGCIIADVRTYKEQAEYALEQLAVVLSLTGGMMMPEEDVYRDVPYSVIAIDEALKVKHGFLDNFLIAGINGGFEKVIDLYKDGGKSIEDSDKFKFIEQKVSQSSEIYLYADLEAGMPILNALNQSNSENKTDDSEDDKLGAMVEELAFNSLKAFGLSLSLSGYSHKVYLHAKSEEQNPILDLLLESHPEMSSVKFMSRLSEGALVGIQIGNPAELLDKVLNVIELFGTKENLETQIQQIESAVGLNLKSDLLSALTGEIGVLALLPKEPVNLKKSMLQLGKLRPIILVGVKDRNKLETTVQKVLKLANMEPMSVREYSYRGSTIYTRMLPLDIIVPGVAFMPSYSFRDDLLILSNSAQWVQDAVDMLVESDKQQDSIDLSLKSPTPYGLRWDELSSSWILIHLNAGDVAHFIAEQKLFDDSELPENAQEKLKSLGSIAVSYSASPEGIGVNIISTSEDNWATKILRGVMVAVYANIASKQNSE